MRKIALVLAVFMIFGTTAYAVDSGNIIIPQTDDIYTDFYYMANSGLIKSVKPDHFKYNPITSYEAVDYII